MSPPLLDIRGLSVVMPTQAGAATVVDNVSLSVQRGRTIGLVGESGSGKSTLCATAIGLPPHGGQRSGGEILFDGVDLARMPPRALAALRGRRIGMVVQDSLTALNPVATVGAQLAESFRRHFGVRHRPHLRRLAAEALDAVGIPDAERRLDHYPHQFSGGMRQRVVIAIAIACRPELLICDEPTSALDVTVQAQILALLKRLQRERGMAIVFVTHNLHVAAQFCDEAAVMYAGRIVEQGPLPEMFDVPAHPYTAALFDAALTLGELPSRLRALPGQQPAPGNWPRGCRFAPRCSVRKPVCDSVYPDWLETNTRRAACWEAPLRLASALVAEEAAT
jgi:oligopeptide/dipeptide ABC transporter ATP-binding protein